MKESAQQNLEREIIISSGDAAFLNQYESWQLFLILDTCRLTPLQLACCHGKDAVVIAILEKFGPVMGQAAALIPTEIGTALHLAAQYNSLAAMQAIIRVLGDKAEEELAKHRRDYATPLHLAVVYNSVGVVNLILETLGNTAKRVASWSTTNHPSTLFLAVRCNKRESVEAIIRTLGDAARNAVSSQYKNGCSMIHFAITNKNPQILTALLNVLDLTTATRVLTLVINHTEPFLWETPLELAIKLGAEFMCPILDKLYPNPATTEHEIQCSQLARPLKEICLVVQVYLPMLRNFDTLTDVQKNLCVKHKQHITDVVLYRHNDETTLAIALNRQTQLGKILATHRNTMSALFDTAPPDSVLKIQNALQDLRAQTSQQEEQTTLNM